MHSDSSPGPRWILGLSLLLVACSLLVYLPGFDNSFWGEDLFFLQRSHQALSDPPLLLRPWVEPFNRPVTQSTFFLEYLALGFRSGLYIVDAALLHAFNSLLLFLLLRRHLGRPASAGAALLFCAGLGTYGKSVLVAVDLGDILSGTLVLATCVLFDRALRSRRPRARPWSLASSTLLFALALGCKESTVMTLVPCAGLVMLAGRGRSLRAWRPLVALVAVVAAYFALQFWMRSGFFAVSRPGGALLSLPMRALRLATLMVLPVQPESALFTARGHGLAELVRSLQEARPALGVVLLALGALWFLLAPPAVRWLLASFGAFLLPYGFIRLPGEWLDIRYAYLAATMFCALAAWGFARLWTQGRLAGRAVLLVALCGILAGDVLLVRLLDAKYDRYAQSPENQRALASIKSAASANPDRTATPAPIP